MKSLFLKIVSTSTTDHIIGAVWALTCLIMSAFTACTDESYKHTDKQTKIILNLRLNTSKLPTRSNEKSETIKDNNGTDSENRINREDIWIAAFDPTNGLRLELSYNIDLDNSISLSINNIDNYSEEIKIIALANWTRYRISSDDLKSVTDLSELRNLQFSLPIQNTPDQSGNLQHEVDYYPLPMYGVFDYTIDKDDSQTPEISIDMIRALAKIEIVDKLQGDIKIESATLSNFTTKGTILPQQDAEDKSTSSFTPSDNDESSSTGDNLIFNKISDNNNGNTFYAYVPEINLGDADSDYRKITLTLSDNKKSEIRLINHSDNKPSAQPSENWQSLKRNHIYRFNITALTSTEPEIEIQPTIRICWYGTFVKGTSGYTGNENTGKFENYAIYLVDAIDKNPINDMTDSKQLSTSDYGESTFDFCRYIEFDLKDEYNDIEYDFNKLMYVLIEESDYRYDSSYYECSYRNLAKDIVKLENKGYITYCWLNQLQYSYQFDPVLELFPEKLKYRIYWMGDIDDMNKVSVSSLPSSTSVTINKIGENKEKNYYYVEFSVIGNTQVITYKIPGAYKDGYPQGFKGRYSINDVFHETINGEDYYVFYAN